MDQNQISWKVLEYKKKEKTVDWYWAVIIIALSICVIAFILGDGLFSIFIIMATIVVFTLSKNNPRLIDVTIDKRGFIIDKDMYPFATLEEFWIDVTEKDAPKILLKSKKLIMPLIIVPIEEYHHLDIRDFLLEFLPEKELHEPLSQKIMEKIGF